MSRQERTDHCLDGIDPLFVIMLGCAMLTGFLPREASPKTTTYPTPSLPSTSQCGRTYFVRRMPALETDHHATAEYDPRRVKEFKVRVQSS